METGGNRMNRDKTIYPIRVGEVISMLEAIYSDSITCDVLADERKHRARFIIARAEEIGIDVSSFHEKSDLISDSGIEVEHE
jgi:hypothetical protein